MKKVLYAFRPSVRRYRSLLWVVLTGMTMGMLLDTVYPYVLRSFIDRFSQENADIDSVRKLFLQLVGLYVGLNISWRIFDYAVALFESKVIRDLNLRSFEALQRQSMRFFENSFSGSLVKRVTRFSNAFEGIADAFFFQIGKDMILVTITLIIFFVEMPAIAWLFLAWIIIFFSLNIALSFWKYPLDIASAKADTAVSGSLADSLTNHSTVKSYGMESAEFDRFEDIVGKSYRKRTRAWIVSTHLNAIQSLTMAVFELLLIWMMIKGWENGTVTVGDFVFFQTYVLWLFNNLWNFGNTIRRVFQLTADAQEMADTFSQISEVKDAPDAKPIRITQGSIRFRNVDFGYNGEKSGAIQGLTLDIPARQSIALVGTSGAGKTTIVKLLLRYFDVRQGSIVIDDQDISTVTQESLRQNVALVPQQPELFHRTLSENIAFAKPNATEEEIRTAAVRAHAMEFIDKLPDGMNTLVGERGVKLSGGERQRIALARAFLCDAPILVLDEATSALDSVTEKLIQDAIHDLLSDRTAIVIAHRLSTIMQMDRIVVMEQGRIIEQGTHSELLERGAKYADLWSHQSGGYIG